MSEMAKAARAAMKSKAHRMAGAGPGTDKSKSIDASGWSEPTDMNLSAKVGARPVSRSAYKRGGAVSGEAAKKRADHKPRASGGRGIVDDFVNRNVKTANASEFGKPHDGGWASGGATNFRKTMHNEMGMAEGKHGRRDGIGKFQRSHKASGGAADIAGMRPKGGRVAKADGGILGKYGKGDVTKPMADKGLTSYRARGPMGHIAIGAKNNADALNEARRSNPSIKPEHLDVWDKAEGKYTPVGREGFAKGGKAKGKTNIIIGIHAGQPQQQPMMAGGPPKPPMPMAPPPQMPPQGPPPGMGGMPPGMMPQPGLQGAPQFPRASGGRAGRKEGGPVVGAKYSAADPNKAEKVKSTKDIPGSGAIGRLAKRSIAQRTYVRPV
jgi:hypothetical protein